jgi:transposase
MLILEDADNELTFRVRKVIHDIYEQLVGIDKKIEEYDVMINKIAKEDERCQRLMQIEGVGPLSATALIAAVGNANVFKNGREMAAWLGLVPKQRSSGNKTILMGISKRGDVYLRMLLIHGGRSVVQCCDNKKDTRSEWIKRKKDNGGHNKAAVAVANKNVRIAWALLAKNEPYKKVA